MNDETFTIKVKDFKGAEYDWDLVEVEIKDGDFLKVKETLQRVGIYSSKDKTLWQSCHILHKRGRYYIVHFKELFALDGRRVDIDADDLCRRNTIVSLLNKWKLIEIVDQENIDHYMSYTEHDKLFVKLRIIPYYDKENHTLKSKYTIGS